MSRVDKEGRNKLQGPSATGIFEVALGTASRTAVMITLAVLLALASPASRGSSPAPPRIPSSSQSLEGFVPKGWKVENKATGDLNGDHLLDAALVLRQVDERNIIGRGRYDVNPRVLIVVLRKPRAGYALAVESDVLIPNNEVIGRRDLPEPDLFIYWLDRLEIEGGQLKVGLDWDMAGAGVVGAEYAFQLRRGKLLLTKYSTWREGPQGESWDERADFVRNTLVIRHDSTRYRPHHEKYAAALPEKPLLSIEQVGSGRDFYDKMADTVIGPAVHR